MRSNLILLVFLLLSGCASIASATGTGWPADVYRVEVGGVYAHDLSEGEVLDLDWADDSSFACWPGTENANFSGSHVFFGMVQPPDTYLTVVAVPEPGLDLSLYLMQIADGERWVPPAAEHAPLTCEAGFDQQNDNNPGEVEYIETLGYQTDVNVLIGVAGANGLTEGGFELEIFLEDAG